MVNSNFVKGLEPVLEKLTDKYGISLDHGKVLIHYYFKSLRKALDDARIPTVILPWGEFRFSSGRMSYAYRRILYWKKLGKGCSQKVLDLRIKVWSIYLKRMQQRSCKIRTIYPWDTEGKRKELQSLREELASAKLDDYNRYRRELNRRKKDDKPEERE